jgi:hypothetical protein
MRSFAADALRNPVLIISLLVAPFGLIAYMAFLRWHTGDGLAFAHIQRAWGREFSNPLENLWYAFVPADGRPINTIVVAWAGATVVSFVLCLLLALKRRYAEAVFCFACLVVSLSAGVGSMVRFAAGLAPLGMILAEVLSRWRPIYYLSYGIMAALGIVITAGWLRESFFVM